MKTLKLEVDSENILHLENAMDEALRQLRAGFTSGDLRTEGIEIGWWEITEDKKHGED